MEHPSFTHSTDVVLVVHCSSTHVVDDVLEITVVVELDVELVTELVDELGTATHVASTRPSA